MLSTERVLRELARAILADPRKLYDDKGRLKPIHSLDEDTAAAIASLDVDEIVTGRGAAASCHRADHQDPVRRQARRHRPRDAAPRAVRAGQPAQGQQHSDPGQPRLVASDAGRQ